jgi:hypothetical protein
MYVNQGDEQTTLSIAKILQINESRQLLENLLISARAQVAGGESPSGSQVVAGLVELCLVLVKYSPQTEGYEDGYPENVVPDLMLEKARAHGCVRELLWAVERVERHRQQ